MIMPKRDPCPSFEFDEMKSRLNKRKHGIDFVQAQALWLDPDRIEFPARKEPTPEARWLLVGMIGGKHWSAVITYRDGRARIISVRRSRPREVAYYEGPHFR